MDFSGGSTDTLAATLRDIQGIPAPTADQLTLPQLEKFVNAGVLTPEQAQAYLIKGNAFDRTTAGNSGLDAEMQAIGKLREIVNSGGQDAESEANIQKILNTMGTTSRGANEAIVADAARRGVANSGLTMGAKLQAASDAAQTANSAALDTSAAAEARNLEAIKSLGGIGGNVQGQEYTADANRASAANAIEQFNAQQNQDIAKLNTTTKNSAEAVNLSNAQDIANRNTEVAHTQAASIPAAQQKAFENALAKAGLSVTAGSNLASAQSTAGQQNAGITGGLLGTAGTIGSAYLAGNPYASLATSLASRGGTTPNVNISTTRSAADGGRITKEGVDQPINMKSGGPVPGQPVIPGPVDTPVNDTVLAHVAPGEIVLPNSVTQPAPEPNKVMDFLRSLPKPQQRQGIHPKAVLDTLRGLSMYHGGCV